MKLLLLALWVGVATVAQAQTERLLGLPDGGALAYSGDWVITTAGGTFDNDVLKMESDSRELYVWIYFTPQSTLRRQSARSLAAFVEYDYSLYTAADSQPFDPDRLILRTINGIEIAEYTFQAESANFPYDITVLYRFTPSGDGISIETTSYNDVEVGDISSLYDMIVSYQPADAVASVSNCEVTLPVGLVLRDGASINAQPVRTVANRGGEIIAAVAVHLDSTGAAWYRLDETPPTYARVIVTRHDSEGCDTLPQIR